MGLCVCVCCDPFYGCFDGLCLALCGSLGWLLFLVGLARGVRVVLLRPGALALGVHDWA